MTLAEVAAVTGLAVHPAIPAAADPGQPSGQLPRRPPVHPDDPLITSVEFDTRRIRPGALFVALTGERVDGHDFIETAAAAGAVAVLGSRAATPTGGPTENSSAAIGSGVSLPLPLLLAPDQDGVLAALAVLARHSVTELARAGLVVVGLTGSSGKTSTKDLIAAVLRDAAEPVGMGGRAAGPDSIEAVVAPPESFNNELGHPYTALRAHRDTRFLVLELSARGPGHIAALARTAPLRIGAVLNVGSAHLGEFGSVEGIAAAKGELVEALPSAAAGGVAILNADDSRVLAMRSRTTARVVTVGTAADADVRAEHVVLDDFARAGFTLVTETGRAAVRLQVAGAHQVGNALTAAAVGLAAGMPLDRVAAALSAARQASRWRMEITELPGGITLVNDAYNANPDSMRAALRSLATIGQHRRTIAVLGEMAELGPAARDAHDAIGRLAVRLGVGKLIVVGEGARALHLGAHLEGSWDGESELVPDVPAAVATVLELIRPGDVVLVKASRSVGLERVATAISDALTANRTRTDDQT